LEIGTLGGYSAVWLARALSPDGKLITLEIDAHHASVARRNIESAGFSTLVEVREGHAIDTLAAMIEEGIESFDLIFIDADKSQYAKYFELALRLTHPGSVILADNVVRGGTVARSDTLDPNTLGIRDFIEAMGASDQVEATAVQTVGLKGYDGFSIAVVRG
jgi:predicted O-methyltransferase YrrM